MRTLLKTALLLLFGVYHSQAIMFQLQPNLQKCLKDDMQGNQIVAGEYEVTGAPGQKINYVVSSRK